MSSPLPVCTGCRSSGAPAAAAQWGVSGPGSRRVLLARLLVRSRASPRTSCTRVGCRRCRLPEPRCAFQIHENPHRVVRVGGCGDEVECLTAPDLNRHFPWFPCLGWACCLVTPTVRAMRRVHLPRPGPWTSHCPLGRGRTCTPRGHRGLNPGRLPVPPRAGTPTTTGLRPGPWVAVRSTVRKSHWCAWLRHPCSGPLSTPGAPTIREHCTAPMVFAVLVQFRRPLCCSPADVRATMTPTGK